MLPIFQIVNISGPLEKRDNLTPLYPLSFAFRRYVMHFIYPSCSRRLRIQFECIHIVLHLIDINRHYQPAALESELFSVRFVLFQNFLVLVNGHSIFSLISNVFRKRGCFFKSFQFQLMQQYEYYTWRLLFPVQLKPGGFPSFPQLAMPLKVSTLSRVGVRQQESAMQQYIVVIFVCPSVSLSVSV